TVDGTALGILDSQVWARESTLDGRTHNQKKVDRKRTPIEDKESYRWLKSFQRLCEIQATSSKSFHFVSICDREGDIFELFLEHAKNTNENKPDLLIRARTNRNITSGETKYLYEELNQISEFAEYDIIIPKKKNSQAREATLRLKFKEVSIKPSYDLPKKNQYPNIPLYAISASEVNPPKGRDPIHWIILTTIPILNFKDAFEKIEWYRRRWVIETFFKTLKSGCKIEEHQFQTLERLQRVLAIDSIIAWRILFLTTLGRECPDLPASVLFEEHEWKALHARLYMTKDVPNEVPKLSLVMRQIGQLGGHLGRKGDGHPGVLALARGLYKLQSAAIMWKLLTYG
ncbi:IS4 family transposase, partial [Leptospira ilyithenensis]